MNIIKNETMHELVIQNMKQFGCPNISRIQEMLCAFEDIHKLSRDTDAKLSCTVNDICKGMGHINLIFTDLTVNYPIKFYEIAALANNIEIYPKTDGSLQMDLTFYNLIKKEELKYAVV